MSRPSNRPRRPQRDVRAAGRVIHVLAEGEVTESDYFDYWRRQNPTTRVVIDLHTAGWAPLKRVGYARDLKRRQPRRNPEFDEIWCVFDVDAHRDVNSAVAEARDADIQVAVSNPCFELWLVLHVEDWTAEVHRHKIQRRASELGLLDGKSIPAEAWPAILNGYDDAKRRARNLDTRHLDVSDPGSNPSSGVWRLIETIRGEPSPE